MFKTWKCKLFGHKYKVCFEIESDGVVYVYRECSRRCGSQSVMADLSILRTGVAENVCKLLYSVDSE